MLHHPLVSVLMPLHNKEADVVEAIESVLNQTYPNIELIIIDDGSTDNSFVIANRYASEKIFVFQQQNKGASAARNTALGYSKGDFIQYLDADDVLGSRKIEEQILLLDGETEVLATSKMFYFIVQKDNSWQKIAMPSLERDYDNMTAFLLDEIPRAIFVHAWLIPRILIEKAGKWNETMTIFDDRDFYLRLVPLASKIVFCEKAICYYRMPDTSKHLSQRCELVDIQGALQYFSRFESTFLFNKKHEYYEKSRLTIACLYKKILVIALNEKVIVDELLMRCVRYKVVPDCSQAHIIQWITRCFGIRIGFQMVVLKMTWFDKT